MQSGLTSSVAAASLTSGPESRTVVLASLPGEPEGWLPQATSASAAITTAAVHLADENRMRPSCMMTGNEIIARMPFVRR